MNRAQVLAEIEKAKQATPGPFHVTEAGGNDCVWIDVCTEDDNEILNGETQPQFSAISHDCWPRCAKEKAVVVADLEFFASAGTNYLALLQQLEAAMQRVLDGNRHADGCCCVKCEELNAYFAKD